MKRRSFAWGGAAFCPLPEFCPPLTVNRAVPVSYRHPLFVKIGVFADCNGVLIGKLEGVAKRGEEIEMESHFCRYRRPLCSVYCCLIVLGAITSCLRLLYRVTYILQSMVDNIVCFIELLLTGLYD